VNPFERPLQKPHPPVWIPGLGSPETLEWAARHHYPYIYLETDPDVTVQMTELYHKAAGEVGYKPGPQNFGYLWRIHVQDTDEKAFEVGKGFLVGNAGVGRVPMPGDFMAPAGYNSRVASKRILEQYSHSLRPDALYGGVDAAGWDKVVLRPGILGVWTNDGTISHKDTMRCLQLMKDDVIPELREMGKELGLPGPFEAAP
jgi:alkanesulfonate monooxygenase SsuD/methylene tetrahydromethanopterin reductase-like flavin-dependent oxidoreductase (luciferase family)